MITGVHIYLHHQTGDGQAICLNSDSINCTIVLGQLPTIKHFWLVKSCSTCHLEILNSLKQIRVCGKLMILALRVNSRAGP